MSPPLSNLDVAHSYLPSPAPEELSESDSDILATLEEKRREIDQEIEAFRRQKEKEFRAFEDELRSRKRRNAVNGPQRPISPISGLSNLMENKLHIDGSINKEKEKKGDGRTLGGLKPALGPSKPSVSLDKVTIKGMTTPPVSGTPPSARTLSRSPTNLSATPPPPSEKETGKSPSLSDRENNFHGLFTPGYLRLLDVQPSSLPQNSNSLSVSRSKRAVTSPTLPPSNSLPSALRTASGTARKRKHVTFRLGDSVVVDPSSSYEESTSPSEDPDDEKLDGNLSDSAIEISPVPLPIEVPRSIKDEAMTSPKKDVSEGEFFSFDEELSDDDDENALKYQDVSNDPDHLIWNYTSLPHHRSRKMIPPN